MASAQVAATNPYMPPRATSEEQDDLVRIHLGANERPLKSLIRRFHAFVHTQNAEGDVEDSREALLAEIAAFQMMLQKSVMVCEAEARQVVEYDKERRRIAAEHERTRGVIAQLKVSLEEAQLLRKQKMEYDQVAEKVNTFPHRSELESSIAALQDEIASIKREKQHKESMMLARKVALDNIIASLTALNALDKELEQPSAEPMDGVEPAGAEDEEQERAADELLDDDRARDRAQRDHVDEHDEGEKDEVESALNPEAKPFHPRLPLDRAPSSASSPAPPLQPKLSAEDGEDIEMGEVSEKEHLVAPLPLVKRPKEELEEGEASDASLPL